MAKKRTIEDLQNNYDALAAECSRVSQLKQTSQKEIENRVREQVTKEVAAEVVELDGLMKQKHEARIALDKAIADKEADDNKERERLLSQVGKK